MAPATPFISAAVTHAPLPADTKFTGYFQTGKTTFLRRIPCECGWRGCWYDDAEYAERSFEQHVQQAQAKAMKETA